MVRIFLDERFSGSGANDIYVPYLSLPVGRTGNRSGRGSGRWSVPTRSSCSSGVDPAALRVGGFKKDVRSNRDRGGLQAGDRGIRFIISIRNA
jgi:hypothetical protein